MKFKISILVFFLSLSFFAQENTNVQKGYAAEGYDVVAYFNNTSTKGDKKFTTTYNDVKYKFSNAENLKTFTKNPEKFIPQYGGYCAYAIAVKGEKVKINPKTFEVRNGKLYLFYNAWGTNTLELWKKESPEMLKDKADKNWEKSINK